MFQEINYFKQFLGKNITTKDCFLCFHKIEQKDEDYMSVAYKENLFSCGPSW